jgi:hypothetical protein
MQMSIKTLIEKLEIRKAQLIGGSAYPLHQGHHLRDVITVLAVLQNKPDAEKLLEDMPEETVKKVTLDWLSRSDHLYAKMFREVASRTPTKECALCAMFFEDEGYSFDEIDEDEIGHFQQIADSAKIPIQIISLK